MRFSSSTDTHSHSGGFYVRDLIRFFIVDIILICAVRVLVALGFFHSADGYVLTLLGSKVILFLYLLHLIRDRRGAWPETGATRAGRWYAWPVCLAVYAGFFVLAVYIDRLNGYFMDQLHGWLGWRYQPQPQEVMILIFEDLLAWPSRVLLVVFTILAGPFMEELAFRGMGLDAYRRESGPGWAVFMTSLLFGAYHFSLQYLFPLSVLGAVFAFARLYSRSLWPAVFLHCAHNSLALAVTAHGLGLVELPFM